MPRTDFSFPDLVDIVLQAGQFVKSEGLSEDVIMRLRITIGDKRPDGCYEIRLYEP